MRSNIFLCCPALRLSPDRIQTSLPRVLLFSSKLDRLLWFFRVEYARFDREICMVCDGVFFRQCVSCFLQVLQILTDVDVWFAFPSCCRYDPWKLHKNLWCCLLRQKPYITKVRKCEIQSLRFFLQNVVKNSKSKKREFLHWSLANVFHFLFLFVVFQKIWKNSIFYLWFASRTFLRKNAKV